MATATGDCGCLPERGMQSLLVTVEVCLREGNQSLLDSGGPHEKGIAITPDDSKCLVEGG